MNYTIKVRYTSVSLFDKDEKTCKQDACALTLIFLSPWPFENHMNSSALTRQIKEYDLSHGAELVGILSPESIDAFPEYWIGW